MKITLSDAGKRFNRDWIFRHFTYSFESGKSYAITGPNGSGKSTLLQVLSGGMHMNEGNIQYSILDVPHSVDTIYRHVSICAPYLELVEEMTLREFLEFHQGFKPLLHGITIDSIVNTLGLEKSVDKQIRYYSSGMKQRVKLAQCIFSNTAIVLLDEPCTNLDAAGIELYQALIREYCSDRLVIVSSNDKVEYSFCDEIVNITDYK
ncbi:MAG TPA: ABC transporter ATP-binding protein [Chitinophagaceae bacterium]|nr:ABC transporter ATP-binding protein [Chitinophagaceae bacterium]